MKIKLFNFTNRKKKHEKFLIKSARLASGEFTNRNDLSAVKFQSKLMLCGEKTRIEGSHVVRALDFITINQYRYWQLFIYVYYYC